MIERWGPALALASAAFGCADLASTRDVRVSILDENSRPLPGAVFYVEASDDAGPFAYLWAVAGRAGEVPDSAREPLKLPWRRGARLAMAAFAPGRRPAVIAEREARIRSDGAVLVLEPGDAWRPELEALGVPFDPQNPLAQRFEERSEAPLRDAFRTAWAARPRSAAADTTG